MKPLSALEDRVRGWLDASVAAEPSAWMAWARSGVAAVRTGVAFSAISVPEDIVHLALETDVPGEVADALAHLLDGGPVFRDVAQRRYFALVPPGVPLLPIPEVGVHKGDYVDVPAAGRVAGTHPSYWVTGPLSPGTLCRVPAVVRIVVVGRARAREEATELCWRCDEPLTPGQVERHAVHAGTGPGGDVLLHRVCPREARAARKQVPRWALGQAPHGDEG